RSAGLGFGDGALWADSGISELLARPTASPPRRSCTACRLAWRRAPHSFGSHAAPCRLANAWRAGTSAGSIWRQTFAGSPGALPVRPGDAPAATRIALADEAIALPGNN